MANGVTQIRRSVMALALPVTVSSLLQRTEGIVAVFLVGGLGAIPIAAVGLGQLLAFIATTLVSLGTRSTFQSTSAPYPNTLRTRTL